jgi:hypothetical protein
MSLAMALRNAMRPALVFDLLTMRVPWVQSVD